MAGSEGAGDGNWASRHFRTGVDNQTMQAVRGWARRGDVPSVGVYRDRTFL